jgi:hypothetical protein
MLHSGVGCGRVVIAVSIGNSFASIGGNLKWTGAREIPGAKERRDEEQQQRGD